MTRFHSTAAMLAMALLLPAAAIAHEGVHVEDGYARVTGEKATSASVYFVIENHGPNADTLLSVTTDAAAHADLHANVEEADGMTSMVPMDEGLAVPGKTTHALSPRGDHLMLMGLTRPLKQGDTVDLILTFAHEGEVRVTVPVDNARKAGEPAPHDMDAMDHDAMAVPTE